MTTIKVDPDGVRLVVDAGDAASHALRETSVWLAGHGLTAGPLGLLSGHGLGAAGLVARMEALAARAGHEGELFADAAVHVADAAARLLSSQLFDPTKSKDWIDFVHDGYEGRWALGRVARYVQKGTLLEHASRWRPGGYLDYRLTGLFGGALSLAGARIHGVYGDLMQEYGTVAVGVNEAVHAGKAIHVDIAAKSWKVVGTATKLDRFLLPLAVAGAAIDTYHLATDQLHDLKYGDARGHSTGQRQALYFGQVAETAGSLALSVAPFTGPAAPFVAAAGAGLMAGGALARGAVFASDWAHDHQADIKATTAAVSHTASSAWKTITHPPLPHVAWSL